MHKEKTYYSLKQTITSIGEPIQPQHIAIFLASIAQFMFFFLTSPTQDGPARGDHHIDAACFILRLFFFLIAEIAQFINRALSYTFLSLSEKEWMYHYKDVPYGCFKRYLA